MLMTATSFKTTIRELDAVTAKLATQRVTGSARLEMLRRQAKLVDLRDAALLARRRAAAVAAGR
jgi:hypothetical protein